MLKETSVTADPRTFLFPRNTKRVPLLPRDDRIVPCSEINIETNGLLLRLDDHLQELDRFLVRQNDGPFQRGHRELLNKLCRILCDIGLEIILADVGQYPLDSELL